MFENNWFLFLLIVMLVFYADGEISQAEASVMLGILCALTFCCDPCGNNSEDDDDDLRNTCFCDHRI